MGFCETRAQPGSKRGKPARRQGGKRHQVAIYSLHHSHVGKSTQAQAGTAGAHVRYITRTGAASLVMAEHMPSGPDAARAWIDEREAADRKNGRVIDKLMLALPVELHASQRADLVREFMTELGGGRVSWMAGIHDRGEDRHNPHAHVILRDKDLDTGKRVIGTSEKGSTDRIREAWEMAANNALERAGLDVRIDRRSLSAQSLDREPGIHVGPNVAAMEDRGIRPVSIPQEVANDRVVNWPEIDQGRTRADRQREIEAGNFERDRERGRGKSGDRSTGLLPPLEIALEPVRPYVPNFVLVPDPLPPEIQREPYPQTVPVHQVDDAPQLVPQAEVAPESAAEIDARQAQGPTPEISGMDQGPSPEASQRPSYGVLPEVRMPDPGRWAGIIAAARDRLAALAGRLDVAFGRVRDQMLKTESRSTRPQAGQGGNMDNGAVIQEAMKPPAPKPKPSRSVAEELLEAGRRHREQNPKPEIDLDRDLGSRRRRMPWEPPV